MFDSIVLNGNIVYPGRIIQCGNIGIRNGKIEAITGPDTILQGAHVIDATGKYIFPGIIETHSHLGVGAGEEDFLTETSSAAIGGVTTILFFLRDNSSYDEIFRYVMSKGEEKAYTDFSFHIVLITEEHLNSIPKYIDEFGITSFKHYLTYRGEDAKTTNFGGNPIKFDNICDGYILESFERLSKYPKAVAIVHAEDIEIVHRAKKRLIGEGRSDLEAWALSRPVIAEVEGVRRALTFAKEAGCRVNILHITSELALNVAIEFRKVYDKVFIEACHPYMILNEKDVTSKKYKLRPPLRTKRDNERLWEAVKAGDINTIGSDHVPRKLAAKMGDIWSSSAGAPGTPFLFPVMLSEGYHKRNMPLIDIAKTLSLNPARLYGLYPHKGDIGVGFDADMVIVDLDREYVLKSSDISQYSDYILYEDLKVKGFPETTMIRGKIVVQNGEVVGDSGWGRFVRR
ncbi:MAG: amidohydrolase family protein [Firmicutes bacterium]|nr:amidohydrolase family protein [Bacillota bacterium]